MIGLSEWESHYLRMADFQVSTTDPDATLMQDKRGGSHLGYHTHYVVDGGKARIILAALVTPSEVMENQPVLDMLSVAYNFAFVTNKFFACLLERSQWSSYRCIAVKWS